jgi:cytidine deaminase
MTAGDQLREFLDTGDALAAYAISKMRSQRLIERDSSDQNARKAWILRTIKHPEEVRLLRRTYGKRFILLSATESENSRRSNIKASLRDADPTSAQLDGRVTGLMLRDELDSTTPFGQHVRDAYAMADFFVDLDREGGAKDEIERIVGLLFGSPFITPRRDEHSMFLAFAASLRSADPGRQVGAVITRSNGDIIAIGSNEVPRPGGGEYWDGDRKDNRDFRVGTDFNRREVRRAIQELLVTLQSEGHLAERFAGIDGPDLTRQILEESSESIDDTRIRNLIEFGRIMHAEMSAITQAARSGASIEDATLYTTAFPCHMCMRLIIGAGIKRVVYVDPYPKSLAGEMYATEISMESRCVDGRVAVEPYFGSSWNVYNTVFRSINRKRDPVTSRFVAWASKTSRMRLAAPDALAGADALEAVVPLALRQRLSRGPASSADVSGSMDDVGTDTTDGGEVEQ